MCMVHIIHSFIHSSSAVTTNHTVPNDEERARCCVSVCIMDGANHGANHCILVLLHPSNAYEHCSHICASSCPSCHSVGCMRMSEVRGYWDVAMWEGQYGAGECFCFCVHIQQLGSGVGGARLSPNMFLLPLAALHSGSSTAAGRCKPSASHKPCPLSALLPHFSAAIERKEWGSCRSRLEQPARAAHVRDSGHEHWRSSLIQRHRFPYRRRTERASRACPCARELRQRR